MTLEEEGRGGEAIIIVPLPNCVLMVLHITLFIYHYRSHACMARDWILGYMYILLSRNLGGSCHGWESSGVSVCV